VKVTNSVFLQKQRFTNLSHTKCTMHPPLDRPHPLCQTEINILRKCHGNNSKFRFWACNDVKHSLDRCLKKEKDDHLIQVNIGFEEKRKRDDDAIRDALGQEQTFDQYLNEDKEYQEELRKAKFRKDGTFKETANS